MKITSDVSLNVNVLSKKDDSKFNNNTKSINCNTDKQASSIKSAAANYKDSIVSISENSPKVVAEKKDTTKSSIGKFFKSVSDKFSFVASESKKFIKTAVSVGESVINTVSSVSKTIFNTGKSISKTTRDALQSVGNKISDSASRISNTVKQVTTASVELKKAAEDIKNSSISLIETGAKTTVSVGADVMEVVGKVGASVVQIKETWNSPNSGVIGKIVQTGGIAKDGINSIKDPIKRIPNTLSTGYNEIKKDYNNIKNSIKSSMSHIQEVKKMIISVSRDVIDTAKSVVNEVKETSKIVANSINDAVTNIKDTVSKGYKDISNAIENGYEKKNDSSLEGNIGILPNLA
ncbi:hypothetical protein ACH36K_00330 [Clostridium sp. MB05]|jgi:phage-related protein|uniref:hypothetical protein n=1 Tax=Clostridium sp. MB05 TaxID=3376682 RepID=UPI0039823FFD